MSHYPGPTTFPGDDFYPGDHIAKFRPPVVTHYFRITGSLFGQADSGLSVWRDAAGAWHQGANPTAETVATATRFYGGGRVHPVDDPEHHELLNAGYGAYIIEEHP